MAEIQKIFQKISTFPKLEPPAWCRGGHLQTLTGHFSSHGKLAPDFSLHKIPIGDGDELISFFHRGQSDKVIVLFHGLAGSTDSGYMVRLGNLFAGLEHNVLLVNHRGAHPEYSEANGIYHSGRSEDMSAVFGWLRKQEPRLFQIAFGFSMSGNILLLNLAGVRSEHKPDFAVVANAPIDLEDASNRLDQGFNRLYGVNFTRDLGIQHDLRKWVLSIREFDEMFTAPRAGYKSAVDYYTHCSASKLIPQIQVPAVVLTAKDDPFISSSLYEKAAWPEQIHFRLENFGGHLGYIQKNGLGYRHWLDEYLAFIVAMI